MASTNPKNWAEGRWSIDSMSAWDREFIDAEIRGYFEFGPDASGSFQFGYVRGQLVIRLKRKLAGG